MALRDCTYCLYQSRVDQKDTKPQTDCGRPCLVCERRRVLSTQIEATKKLLDYLIIEEHSLATDLNRCHDPIQRLPLEITSHIFSLTLSDFVLQETEPKLRQYSARGKGYEKTPLKLGAVCHSWRAIAWSIPSLWSNIMLTVLRTPTNAQIDVVQRWLQRSKPLPLKIRLFLQKNDRQPVYKYPAGFPAAGFEAFVSVFNKHSIRWETLSVHTSNWIAAYFVGNKHGAPHLKTVQLILHQGAYGKFALHGAKPQPISINVAGYDINTLDISWTNVTHVTMDFDEHESHDYLELFRIGIKLVKLHLHCPRPTESPPPTNLGQPIQHPLQELVVSVGRGYRSQGTTFYRTIFDSVTLPLLEHLTLDGPATSLDSVKRLLARSSPPLKSLNLTAKCDQQHALDLLYDLPSSLKKIKLDLQDTTADFRTLCDHLSRAPSVSYGMSPPLHRDLLPSLEEFEYCWTKLISDRIPYDCLPNILRPLSGQQRPLKKLALHPRGDVHQDDPLLSMDNIQESAIRGLIGLIDDGVDLYLPDKVSREDLLAMLEKY